MGTVRDIKPLPPRKQSEARRSINALLKSRARHNEVSGKLFYSVQDALVRERGGRSKMSVSERILIERVAMHVVITQALEGAIWHHGIVNDSGHVSVAVQEWRQTVQGLVSMLKLLGLRPDALDRIESLDTYARTLEETRHVYATETARELRPTSTPPRRPRGRPRKRRRYEHGRRRVRVRYRAVAR